MAFYSDFVITTSSVLLQASGLNGFDEDDGEYFIRVPYSVEVQKTGFQLP